MSHLDVLLAARAAETRRAQLRRAVRQRRLVDNPVVLVPFQPGAEAHTLAALAYGTSHDDFNLMVIGQPLNRQQVFDGLTPVGEWFSAIFEEAYGAAEIDPESLPQIIAPNSASVAALGRVGRRLAYLPTEPSDDPDMPPPAPESLVRFGRQMRWLADNVVSSGQNLMLDLATLLRFHWVTVQTPTERGHLGALDAWIDPPQGVDPNEAADQAEAMSIGPYALPREEHAITDLISELGDAERAGTDTAQIADQLRGEWSKLIAPVWDIAWRSIERLRDIPADENYLPRRMGEDVRAYKRHLDWLNGPTGGRTRTRQSPRQAIREKVMAEYFQGTLEAEEAVSDPLALVDEILTGKAVSGRVVNVNADHSVLLPGGKRPVARPLITIESPRPCLIPVGRVLWWTEDCKSTNAELVDVSAGPGDGSTLVFQINKGVRAAPAAFKLLEASGAVTTFSVYTTDQFFPGPLPGTDPFTHAAWSPAHIESPEAVDA